VQNKLEYLIFLVLSNFLRLLGLKRGRKLSGFIGGIFYYLIPIRKKTVLDNLKLAFPEKPEKEIRKTAFLVYRSFATSLIEILLMPYLSREELESGIYIPDEYKKLFCSKKEEGKGVIMMSAHFGNWEYVAASVGAQLNESICIVVKSQRNSYVNNWMNDARTRWGNKIVPLGASVREIFKQLKEKHVVAMVADQRGPMEGTRVNFFGRKVSVYPGPAMLSLKTKAPILYGLGIRQPDYSYKVHLEEIDTSSLPAGDEEKIIEISQRHTAFLESFIRQYPEQWFWMHKRWKY
jgi:Kdo2-lipid IVA lauroyltransferase/acyltransferase